MGGLWLLQESAHHMWERWVGRISWPDARSRALKCSRTSPTGLLHRRFLVSSLVSTYMECELCVPSAERGARILAQGGCGAGGSVRASAGRGSLTFNTGKSENVL